MTTVTIRNALAGVTLSSSKDTSGLMVDCEKRLSLCEQTRYDDYVFEVSILLMLSAEHGSPVAGTSYGGTAAMRSIITLTTAGTVALGSVACIDITGVDEAEGRVVGSGYVISESRRVRGVDGVSLSGVGRLVIRQGRSESLVVIAEDNIIPLIRSEVVGGRLLLGLVSRHRLTIRVRTRIVAAVEGIWEVTENTPWLIERYREATISLDYYGDSVANSTSDYAMCLLGVWLARSLGWRPAFAIFALFEAISVAWIRDSLLLNLMMLIHPLEGLRTWQGAIVPGV